MTEARDNQFAGKRILVVEDEPLIAMVLATDLEEMGFASVEVAGTLDAAFQSVRALRPDFVLLDVHLVDGHAGPLADLLTTVGVPFVLMSGDSASAIELGLTAPVMSKPFGPAQLQDALNRAVG